MDYPVSGLDLTGMVMAPEEEEPLYDLFAVSNHFGGLGGGHCASGDVVYWGLLAFTEVY